MIVGNLAASNNEGYFIRERQETGEGKKFKCMVR
jgi:hypothetical protein